MFTGEAAVALPLFCLSPQETWGAVHRPSAHAVTRSMAPAEGDLVGNATYSFDDDVISAELRRLADAGCGGGALTLPPARGRILQAEA